MKIKQTILLFVTLIGFNMAFLIPTASAVTCSGVTTSIISCTETGSCPGGENPYEGANPGTDPVRIKAYADQFTDPKKAHLYGKCIGGGDPSTSVESTGVWGLLMLALNILTAGVIVAALGGVVYGSILYTTAGGSPDQVKKARTIIGNVIIGILVYALMYSFMNFIIPGGLFT